jgi:hypothetical protein
LWFGIVGTVRLLNSRRRLACATLGLAVAIQAADIPVGDPFAPKSFKEVSMKGWELASASNHYRHLALFPMQVLEACDPFDREHSNRYMLHAYRLGLSFNSGYFARAPTKKVQRRCQELRASVERGELDPHTLYVVARSELRHFEKAGAVCGKMARDIICTSPAGPAAFREYLSERPPGKPKKARIKRKPEED